MSVVAEPGFMPSVVPCLQREAEFTELLELYRGRKPMDVLEVGTYYGGTLYHWLQNAQPGAQVVSVDSYVTAVDNRHLYDEWTPHNVMLRVVEGNTHAPSTLAEVREYSDSYDWVFIDAGHLYEEVKADWLNYGLLSDDVVCFHDILYEEVKADWLNYGLLADGVNGVVCFHDILYPQVARLWAEIVAYDKHFSDLKTREIISDPTTEWHGIGVVLM